MIGGGSVVWSSALVMTVPAGGVPRNSLFSAVQDVISRAADVEHNTTDTARSLCFMQGQDVLWSRTMQAASRGER